MKSMTALILAFIIAVTFTGWVNAETAGTDSGVTSVTLKGSSITVEGSGATVDGTTLTITSGGTYTISGTLKDGQIRVDAKDEETVKLVLNGATIACSASAPIYVVNAEKTVITLAEGTKNYVTDGDSFIAEDAESDEPDAALFTNDDLTINGDGSLTVSASYNHGISVKDDLRINGGQITVIAVNDGIKGRDSVTVRDGTITVKAGGDGIQSNNDEDAEKGIISIEGGTIAVTAGEDGIQAETSLSISAGEITVTSGGGSGMGSTSDTWGPRGMEPSETESDTGSAKGLKAGGALTVSGGTITLDSSDDSIHSNDSMTINGGTITASSGDDGIHSDSTLEINGGDLRITKSYEGMESAVITLNAGTMHIVASDDGINIISSDDASVVPGRPDQNAFTATGANYLHINGGYIVIDANGDGIDVNGPIEMTGGTVIVNGPTNNGNGALDYLGIFRMTGGYLLAAGSSGMAQAPGTSSTQYAVMLTFASAQPAGTLVHIEFDDGKDILTFMPTKTYQSIVLCSPDLEKGGTYVVYTGGRSTGSVTDGLYSGGIYTPGTEITSFTIAGIVTNAGASDNQNPGTNPGSGTNPSMNPGTNPRGKPGNPGVPTIAPSGTGTLSVTSSPRGASVSLDGAYKGVTPVIITGVLSGTHQITVTSPGYQDYSTGVSVTAGQMASVVASLKDQTGSTSTSLTTPTTAPTKAPPGTETGTLSVTTTPGGATVSLDGTYRGLSPLTLTGVSDGSHELKISKTGYQDFHTSVMVTGGKTTTVSAPLTSSDIGLSQPASSFRTNHPVNTLFPRMISASSVLIEEGSALLRSLYQGFG